MKIEIEVVSTEFIKPSYDGDDDNVVSSNNYKLSFLDQMTSHALMPYIFFYEATTSSSTSTFNDISERSNRLKKSLSKTLSIYYPLTGRIVDNSYVDCNNNASGSGGGGRGITYVEARANCDVLDVISAPMVPYELDKLLPPRYVADVWCMTQATFFKCGGLAIGFAISHKLCDAPSRALFVNNWAAISRGDDAHIRTPIFEGAIYFPPKSDLAVSASGSDLTSLILDKQDNITKRFVFTPSKISTLRDNYSNKTRASRIEALTSFIWTRFMISTQTSDDNRKKYFTLKLPVNFKKRVVPPLSDELFGNFFEYAQVTLPSSLVADGEEDEGTYGCRVVEKLREAIGSIQGNGGSHGLDTLSGEVEVPFIFTSHCRFPLYEADFGWGKPLWIGLGSFRCPNLVIFTDSSSSSVGGIEAWITINKEDMSKFEVDHEFLTYASTPLTF